MARGETGRLHSLARTAALKRWRAAHEQEWTELWALLAPMVRAQNPGASSARLWDLTAAAMRSNIMGEYPQEWASLRDAALTELKAAAGWQPAPQPWPEQRRLDQAERMRKIRHAQMAAAGTA